MTSDQRRIFAILNFITRCLAPYRRLPLVVRLIVAAAALVAGYFAIKLVLSVLVDLLVLALVCFFMVGMVGSVFGRGGRKSKVDPISGLTDREWEEMTDPRGEIRSQGMHF